MFRYWVLAFFLVFFPAYYAHAQGGGSLTLEQRQTLLSNFVKKYNIEPFGLNVIFLTIEKECSPCRTVESHAKRASKVMSNVNFVNVNLTKNPIYLKLFGIDAVPFLIILVDGKPAVFSKGVPKYVDFLKTISDIKDSLKRTGS